MGIKTVSPFKDKKIMLCVTGSIAAYKAAGICSRLLKEGAEVFPVLSPNALYFINPVTFSALSGKRAIFEQFENEDKIYHISLSHSVDAILIAPATANTISKIAYGICDNFLTTAVVSSTCPVLIAPAMNESMYLNSLIQENIKKLSCMGRYFFVEPESGRLACGEEGKGKLANDEAIISRLGELLKLKNDLAGKKVVISAGGTVEFIDSVRYISNESSGKMGFALAEEAYFRGAEVKLVSSAKGIGAPYGVKFISVRDTEEMKKTMLEAFKNSDIAIMAAAVSDIVPEKKYDYKLKKNDDIISKLKFRENINILQLLSESRKKGQYLAGFAAESSENIENAYSKLHERNIDMIIMNNISRKDIGFGSDFNEISVIKKYGGVVKIDKDTKRKIAGRIWDEIIKSIHDLGNF
jgi:phosphopantothenoylcysteine decarboxylase/phosphopantothenate--cysteine ligase